jgi:hypothetical protein
METSWTSPRQSWSVNAGASRPTYTDLYTGRHSSPGSIMTPKSEALALVGAAQRDEASDANCWRQRLEPRVVSSSATLTRSSVPLQTGRQLIISRRALVGGRSD